jgi:histidinol dehydrogenase
MRKLIWSGEVTAARVRELIPRAEQNSANVEEAVASLIAAVRDNGQDALLQQAEKFDGVRPESLRVSKGQLEDALTSLDPGVRSALELAISRVRKVSEEQLPAEVTTEVTAGGSVTLRQVPVDSVGLYVPGGKAVYPSSAIMNVVPAQVAKVPRLAICSPAQAEFGGLPHPHILATAALLGVEEVYSIGGAGAIAALAFGVPEIDLEPVRMVTGPGNIYVATAKKLLRGTIAIDSEAGPTEVLIIADKIANPAFVAADLISQAEHDENAAAVLLTDSEVLISAVERELERQVTQAANRQRVEAALSGPQSALCLTGSIEQAILIANEYATEHLEIQTTDPAEVAKLITNAGAVFLGSYSPVSLGDYLAGSNHVLPTSEQAKFSSGLGVQSFLRQQQVISYSAGALEEVVEPLVVLAKAEKLSGHGDAARIRFED